MSGKSDQRDQANEPLAPHSTLSATETQPANRLRSPRSHRIYHKRYCLEHDQDEVCLCTLGVDHQDRRTTVSKSQQALARWCERVNRAHRAAWAHERNVRAWLHVYGHDALGARAYVGTYARDVQRKRGCLEMASAGPTDAVQQIDVLLDAFDPVAF